MHTMHSPHSHDRAPQTQGRTIHWARWYDLVTGTLLMGRERWIRKMTVEMAGIRPGDKVLDIGCGTGSLTLAAKRQAGATGEVHGVDAAPEMIDVAQAKAAKAGVSIDFKIGLVEHLEFPDDYFDVVLSSLMLHHLPGDLKQRAFAEIRRVLKPGGRLFAVDLQPPTSPVLRHVVPHLIGHGMMQTSVRDYQPMLEAAGLKQVEVGRTRQPLLGFVRATKAG